MKKSLLRFRYFGLALGLLTAPAIWSCNTQTTYQKQLADHENQLKIIDEDTIHNYLVRNNLLDKATRTSSGLYVVSLVDGQGTPVTTGRQVSVKYIGRFLSNGAHPESSGYPVSYGNSLYPAGSIFDNSTENHSKCGCAVFTAGSGAIAGFNEGLLLMRKGDRKLLLIPSRLAYGPAGNSNIPPDAALMFDVEILDVY
ncbi:FKBP-type peptidyl-prolyl cis-trans isomerase [Hymenobacter negativus]|uniref:Peptidyl-prolyl cis-trans isomerase n=1 Tax=Hymenobacter negativus TaxID=2795026 RepID=A0ABS3QLB4_9BACT|nr:FKBP-type peptidyl-prolyl cis-trans isomerase [Hymenobacter negativus]MBO2011768.1 FKBP-type peptidyl-prolyl cis-trans isomerase [Hymenobacter negativus]